MHPSSPSSFQPLPSFINLHPAHFSLHPALCNTLNNIWTKILYIIGQFPQIQAKKLKVIHFDWKLAHMVYWRCSFQPNPDFDFWYSDLKVYCRGNLGPKFQSCLFYLKIGSHRISRMQILNPDLQFWNSELPTLNPLLGKFGLKKSKLFVLPEIWHTRTYTHSISKMLILVLILFFSNFKHKSWGCWFLFWD